MYRAWLLQHFRHWALAEDFSRLAVQVINSAHGNMLERGEMDVIGWFAPRGVMNTSSEFIAAGFLTVGCTASGDWIVIDTRAEEPLQIGFVSHDALWEEKTAPRSAYRPWRDDLLTFLDRLEESDRYAHLF